MQKKDRQRLLALLFIDILLNIMDISFLALLIWLMQAFIQQAIPGNTQLSLFMHHHLELIITILCILYPVKNSLSYYNTKWQNAFAYQVAASISDKTLYDYLRSGFFEYNTVHSSSQFMKISQVPIEFGHYVLRGGLQAIGQLLLITISMTAILIFNAGLFSLLMIILLPPALVVHLLVKKQVKKLQGQTKVAGALAHQHLTEALDGYIEANIYEKTDYFRAKYHESQNAFNAILAEQQSIQSLPSKLMEAFAVSAILLLMLINKIVFDSLISVATVGAFVAAAYRIMPAVVKFTSALSQIRSYQHAIPKQENSFIDLGTHKNKNKLQGIHEVQCRQISYSYGDRWIIQDFNMVLKPGDFVGLSAPSGSGKTTVINLILGFINPDKGQISLNHIPCQEPAFRKYSGIAYVKQSPFLINDTLASNIVLDEKKDWEKLKKVLHVTGLDTCFTEDDIVQKMIGENGRNISGGQRKRIALARALYQGFDFLILDEPFSELDQESEVRLICYLQRLSSEGKIVLLVTHSMNSLSYCNKLIFLHETEKKGINYINTRVS